jgi:hypothetical protein
MGYLQTSRKPMILLEEQYYTTSHLIQYTNELVTLITCVNEDYSKVHKCKYLMLLFSYAVMPCRLMLLFMSVGRDNVSELRPPTGLLFIPKMLYEHALPWWNDFDGRKPKNWEKDTSRCHFIHQKSLVD